MMAQRFSAELLKLKLRQSIPERNGIRPVRWQS